MITIIDYGAGNIQSVCNSLKKIEQTFEVVNDAESVARATKIIFPGMGAAGSAMQMLRARGLDRILQNLRVPLLGICIGQQLLMNFSEENETECLGIIEGRVEKFPKSVRAPQIGWNRVTFEPACESKLIQNIPNNSYFYFANSYAVITRAKYILGTAEYGRAFAAITQKDNFYGVQFHPEKSDDAGLQLLRNFCEKC